MTLMTPPTSPGNVLPRPQAVGPMTARESTERGRFVQCCNGRRGLGRHINLVAWPVSMSWWLPKDNKCLQYHCKQTWSLISLLFTSSSCVTTIEKSPSKVCLSDFHFPLLPRHQNWSLFRMSKCQLKNHPCQLPTQQRDDMIQEWTETVSM